MASKMTESVSGSTNRSKSVGFTKDTAGDAKLNAIKASIDDLDPTASKSIDDEKFTPPPLSRSVSTNSVDNDDWETEQPLDKLSLFDLWGNFGVQQRFGQWQTAIAAPKQAVKRQQERLKSSSATARQRAVEEVRRRLPTADEQFEKYRVRMKSSVDRLGNKWQDTATVTVREKLSFIAGVLNVFISGYLIGAQPAFFYYWFTAQLCYFLPLRFYIYRKKGYHYFLADLCYFVNFLAMLSIWAFPNSKRLFISTYCLAYGNNAIAIAMWRNSMVFHSLDKVTSMFIHIMPPVTLHTIVHLTPSDTLKSRFPAVHTIKFSHPDSPEHYDLTSMVVWATVPYAVWQVFYLFITFRGRDKIAAGCPTSFTYLRKSYANTWIGRLVLRLPEKSQEVAFMVIQYLFATLTIIPCPLWFWYRWASAGFLLVVFGWSVYNGATFYIDVFGKRFEKELEALKKDVAKWQNNNTSSGDLTELSEAIVSSQKDITEMSKGQEKSEKAEKAAGEDHKELSIEDETKKSKQS